MDITRKPERAPLREIFKNKLYHIAFSAGLQTLRSRGHEREHKRQRYTWEAYGGRCTSPDGEN
jgi:hypothetical protein